MIMNTRLVPFVDFVTCMMDRRPLPLELIQRLILKIHGLQVIVVTVPRWHEGEQWQVFWVNYLVTLMDKLMAKGGPCTFTTRHITFMVDRELLVHKFRLGWDWHLPIITMPLLVSPCR